MKENNLEDAPFLAEQQASINLAKYLFFMRIIVLSYFLLFFSFISSSPDTASSHFVSFRGRLLGRCRAYCKSFFSSTLLEP